MSKYSEALEILRNENLKDLGACYGVLSKTLNDIHFVNFDILQEAIEKAEKYDEENITYKKKFEAQLKYIAEITRENEKLREVSTSAGTLKLMEIDKKIIDENQILKEVTYYADYDSQNNWQTEIKVKDNKIISIRKRKIIYY